MKLYKVYTQTMCAYVVAKNPLAAEDEFKMWLDSEDYGLSYERTVIRIELVADTNSKPNTTLYSTYLLIGAVQDDE